MITKTWLYTASVSFMGIVAQYVVSAEYVNLDHINPSDSHGHVIIEGPTDYDAFASVDQFKQYLEGMARLGADVMIVSSSH